MLPKVKVLLNKKKQITQSSHILVTVQQRSNIAGIGVGGFVFLVLVIGVTAFCIATKKKPKRQEEQMHEFLVI